MTANTQSALAKLLCGDLVSDGGSVDEVLNHLSTSIDNVVEELVALLTQESPSPNQISLFAPFLGRSILELGCILQTVHSLTKYETPLQTSPRNGERL
jgi:hypothetical protein